VSFTKEESIERGNP